MNKTIISVVVVVAVIASGIYLWKMRAPSSDSEITRDNVVVTKTDLASAQGAERVPSGIPSDLPLETDRVTESYSQEYVDKGIVIHGFTYMSAKTPSEVLASYKAYMEANRYVIMDEKESYIQANLVTGEELLVSASASGEGTTVQIAYTDKQ